jgi:hypothetical protein
MANTPVSPKVTAGANWAAYATLALTLLSTLTPGSLDFLGKFAPLAYGVVVGATYALGAFLKADPLRQAPADPATVASPVDALTAPPSVYPSDAVAAAEVTAPEVVAPEVTPAA